MITNKKGVSTIVITVIMVVLVLVAVGIVWAVVNNLITKIDLDLSLKISNEFKIPMHPRFTSVNMYRKLCERENIEFKRNKIVDNIGAILEKSYDDARTK